MDGLMLTGIRPGESTATVLDCPSLDMASVLDIAKQSAASGVREISLSDNAIMVKLNQFTEAGLLRLVELDQNYGGGMDLLEMIDALDCPDI